VDLVATQTYASATEYCAVIIASGVNTNAVFYQGIATTGALLPNYDSINLPQALTPQVATSAAVTNSTTATQTIVFHASGNILFDSAPANISVQVMLREGSTYYDVVRYQMATNTANCEAPFALEAIKQIAPGDTATFYIYYTSAESATHEMILTPNSSWFRYFNVGK
jgi:hypothetical protein